MKESSQTVARSYAQALYDAALSSGQTLEEVRRELASVTALLVHDELRRTLDHPAIPLARKKRIFLGIWRGSLLVARLVELLLARKRLMLLPTIERRFVEMWNAYRRVETAEVVCAQPIDAAQNSALREALERASGRKVEMSVQVNAGILGGVVVRMGGLVIDGAVKSRLAALREHLLKGTLGA